MALAAAYAAENWSERTPGEQRRRAPPRRLPHARSVTVRLEEYGATGLDEVILGGMDDAPSMVAALAAAQGAVVSS